MLDQRSVTEEREIAASKTNIVSERPLENFQRWLRGGGGPIVIAGMSASALMAPGGWPLWFGIGGGIYLYHKSWPGKRVLPVRKPLLSEEKDLHQPHPLHGKPTPAKGITYLGVTDARYSPRGTQEEAWLSNSDERAHMLIFGTTGSGKTELILSLIFNTLVQGSGMIMVDGKGDVKTAYAIYSMVRRMGREDDLLVINYMTGGQDIWEAEDPSGVADMTNTTNPFGRGSSSNLSEIFISLMSSSDGGGGDMWNARAQTFVSALIRVLKYLDSMLKEIDLGISTIREYFPLIEIMKLVNRTDIPPKVRAGLMNYCNTLPGLTPEVVASEKIPEGKASEQILNQHGFITMQLTQTVNMLADDYGHIFGTNQGHVDFYDVVVNRRILAVLLPALEKAEENLGHLGKIIVSALKNMMGSTLGDKLRGSSYEILDQRVTNSPSAFRAILDELGYYMVPGIAVIPAQARSLGFGMVFAGQDYAAFEKNASEEAKSLIANTSTKIAMKTEDPNETLEIFKTRVGQATISRVAGQEIKHGAWAKRWADTGQSQLEERDRLDLRDMTSLNSGEAWVVFGDWLHRIKTFFANPPKAPEMRLNEFLPVPSPTDEEAWLTVSRDDAVSEILDYWLANGPQFHDTVIEGGEQMREWETLCSAARDSKRPTLEPMVAGLLTLLDSSRRSNMSSLVRFITEKRDEQQRIKEERARQAEEAKKAAQGGGAGRPGAKRGTTMPPGGGQTAAERREIQRAAAVNGGNGDDISDALNQGVYERSAARRDERAAGEAAKAARHNPSEIAAGEANEKHKSAASFLPPGTRQADFNDPEADLDPKPAGPRADSEGPAEADTKEAMREDYKETEARLQRISSQMKGGNSTPPDTEVKSERAGRSVVNAINRSLDHPINAERLPEEERNKEKLGHVLDNIRGNITEEEESEDALV